VAGQCGVVAVCGDGTCQTGENCPADVGTCSDLQCYEPACTNGCVNNPVSARGTDEACTSPNFCDGSGNCVECISAGDCNDGDVCTIDSCSGGVCQHPYITCDDGKECTQDVLNCPFVGCEFQNLPQGTSCSTGYCDGSGTCVECTQDSHCPADYWLDNYQCSGNQPQRKKRDYYCSVGSCTYQDIWQNYGSACSGATPYCAGSGNCVECIQDSHCDDGIICTIDSCSSGNCVNTPNSALCESWEECIIGVGCTQTECAGCEDCDGWFSGCDYNKCHNECQIFEACYYRGVVVGENCVVLNDACNDLVSSCNDYSDQECVDDPCNVAPVGGNGCELDGGGCVDASYCGDGVCDSGEDCSWCSDCACGGATPYCSEGECVECLSDSNCTVLGEYCNPITNQCTVPQQCEDCGGWLGFGCDEQECHDIGECYFDDNFFLNDCINLTDACLVIENCEDYSVEECINNPCNIVGEGPGCGLNSDNECVEVPYCGKDGCDAFECLEINNLIECNDWTQHTGFEDEFLCAWKCSDGPCPPSKIIEGECNFCSIIPNTCSGYNNEETCEIDPCYKADWDCSFLDCNNSQNYYCWWDYNENTCKFNATIGEHIFCTYHAKIIEECGKFDTQRRILKYTGEPAENCPLKIVETPCANVVKLDFFNWVNAVIVIIILVVIYYVKGEKDSRI